MAKSGIRRRISSSATRACGSAKIVSECTLPLTGSRIITDLAVIDVTGDGLLLRKLAPGISIETVRDRTHAPISAAQAIDIVAT